MSKQQTKLKNYLEYCSILKVKFKQQNINLIRVEFKTIIVYNSSTTWQCQHFIIRLCETFSSN